MSEKPAEYIDVLDNLIRVDKDVMDKVSTGEHKDIIGIPVYYYIDHDYNVTFWPKPQKLKPALTKG